MRKPVRHTNDNKSTSRSLAQSVEGCVKGSRAALLKLLKAYKVKGCRAALLKLLKAYKGQRGGETYRILVQLLKETHNEVTNYDFDNNDTAKFDKKTQMCATISNCIEARTKKIASTCKTSGVSLRTFATRTAESISCLRFDTTTGTIQLRSHDLSIPFGLFNVLCDVYDLKTESTHTILDEFMHFSGCVEEECNVTTATLRFSIQSDKNSFVNLNATLKKEQDVATLTLKSDGMVLNLKNPTDGTVVIAYDYFFFNGIKRNTKDAKHAWYGCGSTKRFARDILLGLLNTFYVKALPNTTITTELYSVAWLSHDAFQNNYDICLHAYRILLGYAGPYEECGFIRETDEPLTAQTVQQAVETQNKYQVMVNRFRNARIDLDQLREDLAPDIWNEYQKLCVRKEASIFSLGWVKSVDVLKSILSMVGTRLL